MQVYLITNLVNGKYYVGKTVKKSLRRYLKNACSMARARGGTFYASAG